MKLSHAFHANFSRYFAINNKVFLVNISSNRHSDQYESLSGIIQSFSGNRIIVQIPYSIEQFDCNSKYKITTESFGVGLQIAAEIQPTSTKNELHMKLISHLEVFKRCEMPRINTSIKIYHQYQNTALFACKKQYEKLTNNILNVNSSNNDFVKKTVNLSVSGLRITSIDNELPTPLSICALDLEDKMPPVYAITETTWSQRSGDKYISGQRFINISKKDQNRINRYVHVKQRENGIKKSANNVNWVLMDKMTFNN